MRFAISGDPVSMFAMNATTTFKSPNFDIDLIKDTYIMVYDPSVNNVEKVTNSVNSVDPLMGLHNMSDSYSNPSTTLDFVKSGITGAVAVESKGII